MRRLRYQLRDFFPRRARGLCRPGRPRCAGAAGQGPGPGVGGAAEHRPDQRCAQRAGRRGNLAERTAAIRGALRSPQLAQPPRVTAAGAAVVRALAAVITTLNQQIKALESQVEAHFARTRTLRSSCLSPAWGQSPAPGCWPSSATTKRDTPRRSPQELRGDQPDHPPVRQEEDRHGPLRAQRPAPRRPGTAGLLSPDRLSRRPRIGLGTSALWPASYRSRFLRTTTTSRFLGVGFGLRVSGSVRMANARARSVHTWCIRRLSRVAVRDDPILMEAGWLAALPARLRRSQGSRVGSQTSAYLHHDAVYRR